MKGRSGKRIIGFILFGSMALFGLAAIVMLLWNFAAVPALGLGLINYWQAMGLLVLSKILFTGIRPKGGPSSRHRHWEKWRNMSPEDREAFKARWKSRKNKDVTNTNTGN